MQGKGGLGNYIRSIRVDGERTIPNYFNNTMKIEINRYGDKQRSLNDPWMKVFNAAACNMGMGILSNVWLLVSVEDQLTADKRIPLLLQCPAAVRGISYEPALKGIDINKFLPHKWECQYCGYRTNDSIGTCHGYCQDKTGKSCDAVACKNCGKFHGWSGSMREIQWVIAGCESGPKRRHSFWPFFYSIKHQCQEAHVPLFMKQLEIDGKVTEDITKFPIEFQIRQYPQNSIITPKEGVCR